MGFARNPPSDLGDSAAGKMISRKKDMMRQKIIDFGEEKGVRRNSDFGMWISELRKRRREFGIRNWGKEQGI
jgi:hypothetical protein